MNELQRNIVDWSKKNFGDQKGLNHIAPFLGIGEELLELESSITDEERRDAYADIFIYSCDFLGRLPNPIKIESIFNNATKRIYHSPSIEPLDIVHLYLQMNHYVLKHHQQIRGIDDQKLTKQVHYSMSEMLVLLDQQSNYNLYSYAKETFDRIVSKRDWTCQED